MEEPVAAFVYVDLDGSGMLEEIVMSRNSDGDVTIDVAFDVPEKRADEYSSDPDLGLEIKDVNGDGYDDLSVVDRGKTVGLVEADWASLAKDSCGKEDYESDAQVVYRQVDDDVQMGPLYCFHWCSQWRTFGDPPIRECIFRQWKCHYTGYAKG